MQIFQTFLNNRENRIVYAKPVSRPIWFVWPTKAYNRR